MLSAAGLSPLSTEQLQKVIEEIKDQLLKQKSVPFVVAISLSSFFFQEK